MFPTTGKSEEARRIKMCVIIVRGRDIGPISAKMIKRKGGGVGAGTGRGGAAAGGVIGKKGGGVKAAVRVRAVVQIRRVLVVKGIILII